MVIMKKFFKYIINKLFDKKKAEDICLVCFNYELSDEDVKYLNNKIDELFKTK